MNLPEDAVLVDTRPRPAYEAGHLPGARHLDLSAPKLRLREEAELKALEGGLTELFQTLGLKSPVVLYDEGLTSRLCRTAFFLGLGGLGRLLLAGRLCNGAFGLLDTVLLGADVG